MRRRTTFLKGWDLVRGGGSLLSPPPSLTSVAALVLGRGLLPLRRARRVGVDQAVRPIGSYLLAQHREVVLSDKEMFAVHVSKVVTSFFDLRY